MKLNDIPYDEQVSRLRSILSSGKNSLTGFLALFAFRHHLATKHSENFDAKPILRWYLGQLAKDYISKYYKQAKETLDNLVEAGLLELAGSTGDSEYSLNEELYPSLLSVLEDIFGKEHISNEIARAKFFKTPKSRKINDYDSEVKQ